MRPTRFKAVIFDMDGVLADSQPLHYAADEAVLSRNGAEAERGFVCAHAGRSLEDRLSSYIREFGFADSNDFDSTEFKNKLAELTREHLAVISRLLDESALAPSIGVQGFLSCLMESGIKTAVASSSSLAFVNMLLKKIGLLEFFPVIVSGENVLKGKPAPDVFLEAARALGVSPADCAVIEDSAGGVIAAKAAGMFCAAYRNPTSGAQNLSPADVVFESFIGAERVLY